MDIKVGSGGDILFNFKDPAGRPKGLLDLGVSKEDQKLFICIPGHTFEQSMIAQFGTMEKYLAARTAWEEEAMRAGPMEQGVMQAMYKRHRREGGSPDGFWKGSAD